jgi:uncharacterized protein YjbJ (UPF0337 family)
MNKDQVKGSIKEFAGKVQRKTGELIDSPEQEIKGGSKEIAGKAQKKLGDVKEAAKKVSR